MANHAIEKNDEALKELAIRRILLLHGVTLSIGGIPLIYLGEEWGMLNDYDFVKDPAKAGDTRWVHRPRMKWEFLDDLDDRITSSGGSIRKRIYRSLQRMIDLRKSMAAFYGAQMELFDTDNEHVLGFVRSHAGSRVVVVANFSEVHCTISGNHLRTAGLGRFFRDAITSEELPTSEDLQLAAYQILWLQRI